MTKKERDKMLWEGCESGDFDKVRLAINFGADLKVKNKWGYTTLHMASWRNYIETAKLLIDAGADLEAKDYWDNTPLHYASARNLIEIAKLLIERGADVEANDEDGRTPVDRVRSDEMRDLLK